jgi:hypothetical protein
MIRQFLCLGGGALALAIVLGAPGQVRAQHMRGGFSHGMNPVFHGMFMPGFHPAMPGFNGMMFMPGFRGTTPGFNRTFNRGFVLPNFGPRFVDPRFGGGFTPGFTPGFGPGFLRFF